jgi:hypothetical protein
MNRKALYALALSAVLSGVTHAQTAGTPDGRRVAGATLSASAPSSSRAKTPGAGPDAANATNRDLSDGAAASAPPGASPQTQGVRRPLSSYRRDPAATSRDLSDSNGPSAAATGAAPGTAASSGARGKRRPAARTSDSANSPTRDLSDGSAPSTPSALGRAK